ncbi:MAG: MFS transporter [Methanomassiliicoccus sp.]|nr:MFS transporter [Methanomassiliicoccus sp.]
MGCTNSLTETEVCRGFRGVINDGVATSVMSTLTSSTFLTAFALSLGASELVIGLLAMIPALANIIQLPTIYLIERVRVRRSITITAAALSRAFWLVIAIIPMVVPFEIALPLVLVALVPNSILGSIGGCSWNSWMHDLLPTRHLGKFFSKRMLLATASSIPMGLFAGFFLTWWGNAFPSMAIEGYSILFIGGFVVGLIGVLCISTIPEPEMTSAGNMPKFGTLLRKPFEDPNFKNLIVFLTSWSFAINLALPFLSVYMLTSLGMDTSSVMVFTVIGQISSLAFFKMWGNLSDRYSNKSVLRVSGPILIGCFLLWASTVLFHSTSIIVLLVVVAEVMMGMATSGVGLVSGNISLKLAPSGEATAYLASSSLFAALATGIAPLLGGIIAMYVPNWEYFFLAAAMLGFFSLHRLTLIKEDGEVQERVVVKELLCEIRKGCSASHLRKGIYDASVGLVEATAARYRRSRTEDGLTPNSPLSSRRY